MYFNFGTDEIESYEIPNRTSLKYEEVVLMEACAWLVKNEETIEITSKKFNYSATTFWRRIHCELYDLSPGLYVKVLKQFEKNLKHHRKRR